MTKRLLILFISIVVFGGASVAQVKAFSLATDLGFQRSFKKDQRFNAGGQTLHFTFHLAPKDAIYTWVSYYSNGKFSNRVEATAKLPLATPQTIPYSNNATMRFKQISVGWKKYLKGSYNIEYGWNIYGYAGFGLLLGRIENNHSVLIDTFNYNVPVRAGKANFKRLTADLGLGWEQELGANIYLYTEGRVWIPTTSYPSKYLFVNNNAPLVAMLNVGVRILFE